jgi:hypothetical protein
MAAEERICIHQTDLNPKTSPDMLFNLTVLLCLLNAVTTVSAFFLYVKTRLAGREEDPDTTPEQHARRIAGLDARERKYQSLHFISLALFVLFGVLLLLQIHDHVD